MATSAGALEIKLRQASAHVSVVNITGIIEPGDGKRVEEFLARLPADQPVTVWLNSPGGAIVDALRMGRYFHRNRVRTYVAGRRARCISACALAFLGGRDPINGRSYRVKGSRAKLVFHSFQLAAGQRRLKMADMQRAVADTQDMILLIAEYMTDIGADMAFMSAALSPPGTKQAEISNREALRLGIQVIDADTGRSLISGAQHRRYAQAG